MEGYPFKRLSHNDDSNGLSCFANDNGKKSQYAFKGRTNSSKTGGSIIFESWRWKGTICIIIACFLAVDFMLQGKITTLLRHYDTADSGKKPDPLVLELKALRFVPNLTEILDSGDRVKFVPHKLIEKFREKNGGTNSTSDMEQRKPIPIKAPQLALLSFDLLEKWLSKHPEALMASTEKSLFKELALYQDYHGLESFRKAIASFMEALRGNIVKFEAERIVNTAGATAANELLMFCLADPGDVFLVPTPYYAGSSLQSHFLVFHQACLSTPQAKSLMQKSVLKKPDGS